MLRTIILGSPAPMLAAVVVKKAEETTPEVVSQQLDDRAHFKCKPSELPLYAPLHSFNKTKMEVHPEKNSKAHNAIESGVRVVRTEVQSGYHFLSDKVKTLEGYVETAKAHSQSTIDYLNEPQNTLPRGGAIAIGGLSGFIFAARGGFIKKVLYTAIGAGAIASLCYPNQAEHIARDALYEARKGYAIAYNFVKGVKPGDEVPIEPISKFPTTVQDIKLLALDLYDSAKDAVFSTKK